MPRSFHCRGIALGCPGLHPEFLADLVLNFLIAGHDGASLVLVLVPGDAAPGGGRTDPGGAPIFGTKLPLSKNIGQDESPKSLPPL